MRADTQVDVRGLLLLAYPVPALFPPTGGALARLPNRGKVIPRRPTTFSHRYPYAFTSRVSTSPVPPSYLFRASRGTVHIRAQHRGAPPSFSRDDCRFPLCRSPPLSLPFTNGHVGQVTLGQVATYLLLPSRYPIPSLTASVVSHHALSPARLSSSLFLLHSLRYHDIVFARIRPSPVGS